MLCLNCQALMRCYLDFTPRLCLHVATYVVDAFFPLSDPQFSCLQNGIDTVSKCEDEIKARAGSQSAWHFAVSGELVLSEQDKGGPVLPFPGHCSCADGLESKRSHVGQGLLLIFGVA